MRNILKRKTHNIVLVHAADGAASCPFDTLFENTPTDLVKRWKLFTTIAEKWFEQQDYQLVSVSKISHKMAEANQVALKLKLKQSSARAR